MSVCGVSRILWHIEDPRHGNDDLRFASVPQACMTPTFHCVNNSLVNYSVGWDAIESDRFCPKKSRVK